jgi:hypothetical protein
MSRLSALILSLLIVLSLGLGSAAHAMEAGAGIEVPQSLAWAHSSNDGDQVPADSDKNYPHHHVSCHGDHVGVPVMPVPVFPVSAVRACPLAWDQGAIGPASTDPALRPPQA